MSKEAVIIVYCGLSRQLKVQLYDKSKMPNYLFELMNGIDVPLEETKGNNPDTVLREAFICDLVDTQEIPIAWKVTKVFTIPC